jgi:hypothetical protein
MIFSICIMPSYDVQFSGNNVFDRFQNVRGLKGKQKESTLVVLQHELYSDIVATFMRAGVFTGEEREYYGEQPNIHQRGYVDNLHSSGRLVLASIDDVLKYCTKKGKPEDVEKKEEKRLKV